MSTPAPAPPAGPGTGPARPPAPRGQRIVPGIASSALIGGLALTSGVALTASSGWLIVAASFRPQILTLLAVIVLVRAFGIARPVLRYAERVRSHDAALAFLAEERTRTYQRLIPLTPARLGRRGRGDVLAGVVDDLDDIAFAQVRVVVPLVALGVTGVLAMLLNAFVLFPAAAVTGATVLAALAAGTLDYIIEQRTQAAVVSARARVALLAATVTSSVNELRAIGGETAMLARVAAAERELTVAVTRQARGRALGAGLAPLVAVTGGVTMAFVTEPWVQAGLATPLAALLVLTPVALGEVIGGVPDAVGALARSQAAGRRLRALLAQAPAVAQAAGDAGACEDDEDAQGGGDPGAPGASPGAPGAGAGGIALAVTGVTASWDGTRVPLPPVSAELPPGTHLAISGPNGCGKSTLLAVLARHLDPASGSYTQNGTDVLDLPLATARSGLAVVDDETHVLASTVRENLRFTRPGAGDEQILAALRLAGLGPWAEGLPAGLDTRLGAGGQGLSGGERTRLGIARALLSGRPVVLLDEPVAHLDHPTAVAVLADLRQASAGRTVVLVSHRDEGLAGAGAHLRLGCPGA